MTIESTIRAKAESGERIDAAEAVWLLTRCDLHLLAELSDRRREAVVGNEVFFQHNFNLNYTNVCANRCPLCAFHREKTDGYTMTVDEVVARVERAAQDGVREVHVVGGLNSDLPYQYYIDLVSRVKAVGEGMRLQAYTLVEIDFMSRISGKPTREVLADLKGAGLDSIPGGGAEIFSQRVRSAVCPEKISGDAWLRIAREAHEAGIPSNATMLYGHVEKPEEIVDHISRLRTLQDETHGFQAFVPLAFYGANTRIPDARRETFGETDMRVLATARLFLDNFVHLKSLWMTLGYKAFQVGLEFGADDMGATYYDELIVHSAGAATPRGLSARQLCTLAQRLGRVPVETYSDYQRVERAEHGSSAFPRPPRVAAPEAPGPGQSFVPSMEADHTNSRLSKDHAVHLLRHAPTWELGKLAHAARKRMVPGDTVTFVIDRIINVTNVCNSGCSFCAFHVEPGASGEYVLSEAEVLAKVDELVAIGGTQVMLQGGLNPALGIEYYEGLFKAIRARHKGLYIHSLSPAEVVHLSKQSGLAVRAVLERLRSGGLGSLPGGGAELLVDSVRSRLSPGKLSAGTWQRVMREAAALGMQATATMVFGADETLEERVEHLDVVRRIQDDTGVFRAFIPWTFSVANTKLSATFEAGGAEYLRMLALSRLYLDNVVHIGSGWLSEGMRVAQLGLHFGADDMGGVLMEERVLSAAGTRNATNIEELKEVIRQAGFVPAQRDTQYKVVRELP